MTTTAPTPNHDLLRPPNSQNAPPNPHERLQAPASTSSNYLIPTKTYQQQYSDLYFLRLAALKPVVVAQASQAWSTRVISGQRPRRVDRVLDVRQGELCYVVGTVYMDMPLKPNILEDISADHFLLPPPPREKFCDGAVDSVMLEDDSGRLKLVGGGIDTHGLVTGCVIAVLGSENREGEFRVVEVLEPGLAPQPQRPPAPPAKVAIASGLGISGSVHEDVEMHLLAEYLAGELGGDGEHAEAAGIAHLILAGNSLGVAQAPDAGEDEKKKTKKYGYDATAYNPAPTRHLDALLSSLLPSLPITLLPGPSDPATTSLPQQPLHSALFPTAKVYSASTFAPTTNPAALTIAGTSFLVTAGQNIDDIYRYVESSDRLAMAERCLRWRVVAPTCPDTLWAYPFVDRDPFVIHECPRVLVVGNQPRFETRLVEGPEGQRCRVVLVPRFDREKVLVLVDTETLEVETVKFAAEPVV